MYYRSKNTGKIVTDYAIRAVRDIYGIDRENLLRSKTIEPVENPSVIDCLRDGNRVVAIKRYRELHECDLKEARAGVDLLEKDMARFRKKRKKAADA